MPEKYASFYLGPDYANGFKRNIEDKKPRAEIPIHCLSFCPHWINLKWSRSEENKMRRHEGKKTCMYMG